MVQGNSRGRPPVEEKVVEKDPDKNVHFKDLDDMRGLIERQNNIIGDQKEEIKILKKKVEENEKVTSEMRSEFGEFRKRWQSTGDLPNAALQQQTSDATVNKIETLVGAYNDIQDRLYEIDKSWKNNLIFYGIPMESNNTDYEDPYTTEEKIRGIIKRKLRISREMHLNRVTRIVHGPEFRGQKPIQVHRVFNLKFKLSLMKNIAMVHNCPDITVLGFHFGHGMVFAVVWASFGLIL